jgi:hypothetical protein
MHPGSWGLVLGTGALLHYGEERSFLDIIVSNIISLLSVFDDKDIADL